MLCVRADVYFEISNERFGGVVLNNSATPGCFGSIRPVVSVRVYNRKAKAGM